MAPGKSQNFGQNRNSLFWAKYLILAKKKAVLAHDFLPKFAAKISQNLLTLAKTRHFGRKRIFWPKREKQKYLNRKQAEFFGRNRTETVSVCPLVLQARRAKSIQGNHSGCGEPPIDFKTEVPLWPGLPWSSQDEVELLF